MKKLKSQSTPPLFFMNENVSNHPPLCIFHKSHPGFKDYKHVMNGFLKPLFGSASKMS